MLRKCYRICAEEWCTAQLCTAANPGCLALPDSLLPVPNVRRVRYNEMSLRQRRKEKKIRKRKRKCKIFKLPPPPFTFAFLFRSGREAIALRFLPPLPVLEVPDGAHQDQYYRQGDAEGDEVPPVFVVHDAVVSDEDSLRWGAALCR